VTEETLANRCKVALETMLSNYNDSKVIQFTPSIQNGVRYIGFAIGQDEFFIEVQVSKCE